MTNFKYIKTAKTIREMISKGQFMTGKMPPEPSLMKQFGVGKITIYKALQLLAEEGVVRRVKSKGTFVNGIYGVSLTTTRQVAVVMEYIGHYYSALAKHLRRILYEHSFYSIMIDIVENQRTINNNSIEVDNRLAVLLNSDIHGVIYDGSSYYKFPFLDKYPYLRSIAINCFDGPGDIPGSAVFIDFEKGVAKTVKHLAGKGLKKITFLNYQPKIFPIKDPVHKTRHPVHQMDKGYLEAMDECGLRDLSEIVRIDMNTDINELIRDIITRSERPDAIICRTDFDALKIIMMAFSLGIKVPEELSVTGMYNTPWAEESPVKITSLYFKEELIAEEAVKLILAALI